MFLSETKAFAQRRPFLIHCAEVLRRAVGKYIACCACFAGIGDADFRPFDADFRVVSFKYTFVTGMVEVRNLITEFGGFAAYEKAMDETF